MSHLRYREQELLADVGEAEPDLILVSGLEGAVTEPDAKGSGITGDFMGHSVFSSPLVNVNHDFVIKIYITITLNNDCLKYFIQTQNLTPILKENKT